MISVHALLAFPGLMAGLLLWSRVIHLMSVVTGITSTTDPAPAIRVSFRKLVLLLGALVCSWLMVFAGLAFYTYWQAESAGWLWFFGGVAATPAVVVLSNVRTWMRWQRRRATAK